MHLDCQSSVSWESICVLSWKFQRMFKGEYQLTKSQYVHTATNTTTTPTFISSTTTTITIAPTSIFTQLLVRQRALR